MKNIMRTTSQEGQVASDQQEAAAAMELKSLSEIVKEAIGVYQSKFKVAIGIMSIPVVIAFMLSEFSAASVYFPPLHQANWPFIVKIVLWMASLFFNIIAVSALLFSIKDETGIKQSYVRSLKNPYLFISTFALGAFVVVGGFTMFIIPGIIFSIWFSFAPYIVTWEHKTGLDALRRSRYLVEGYFWKVSLRLFVAFLVMVFGGILSSMIGQILKDSLGIVTGLSHLFLTPLVVFFGLVLFQNLVTLQPKTTVPDSNMFKKTLCRFATIMGIFVFALLAVFQMMLFFTNDIRRPNDSELQLQVTTVPEEENSFYIFREAKDKIYWPQEDISKSGNEEVFREQILQKNEQSLSIFERGVNMPAFQIPELQDPKSYKTDNAVTSVAFLRNLAKINSLRAVTLFEQGKQKESLDQSMKTIKMGQMMEDGQNGTAGYLTGLLVKEIGLDTMRSLIKKTTLSSSEILFYENELNKYIEGRFGLQRVLEGEYMTIVNSQEEMGRAFLSDTFPVDGDFLAHAERAGYAKLLEPFMIKSLYYYKPNKTAELFMEVFKNLLQNSFANSYAQVNHPQRKSSPWYSMLFMENRYGIMMAGIPGISLDSVFSKKFEEHFSVRTTQILLALKAYKRDNGRLPDSLNNLVPVYISALPQDPFDGKMMKYSADKRVVYSTGKDFVDNEGDISETDWRQGGDVGFRVNF